MHWVWFYGKSAAVLYSNNQRKCFCIPHTNEAVSNLFCDRGHHLLWKTRGVGSCLFTLLHLLHFFYPIFPTYHTLIDYYIDVLKDYTRHIWHRKCHTESTIIKGSCKFNNFSVLICKIWIKLQSVFHIVEMRKTESQTPSVQWVQSAGFHLSKTPSVWAL